MFKKAERFLTNPTLAITGPTGSGKTFSALRLASGISKAMGKPFAVIDTENGSASLYSDVFDFQTVSMNPPFTTEKYIMAINEAEKHGFCALVIDSITHAWAGEGGLLEQKGQLDARPGSNSWANWNPIKAKDLKFKSAYLHSNIPFLIATMRSKMEYAQSESDGKKKVQKMGMAPVQSEGIEYEFSVVFDVAMNHECEVSKDRTGLFAKNPIFTITEQVGEDLVVWRNSGKELPTPPAPKEPTPPTTQGKSEPPTGSGQKKNFVPASPEILGYIEQLCLAREVQEGEVRHLVSNGYEFKGAGIPLWIAEELIGLLELDTTTSSVIMATSVRMQNERKAKALVGGESKTTTTDSAEPNFDEESNKEFHPGDYKIEFGRDKNKTLKAVGPKAVQETLDWIKKECVKPGKNLAPSLQRYVEYGNQFIGGAQ